MARILILQEMEQNIANIKKALLPHGHQLTFVRHELQALHLLQQEKFDLIICAVYLEASDVFDFTRAVKHQPSLQHIPLVFYCSANSTFARSVRGGLKIAAESVGVNLYITMEKFDGDLFAEQIEDCLRKSRLDSGSYTARVSSTI